MTAAMASSGSAAFVSVRSSLPPVATSSSKERWSIVSSRVTSVASPCWLERKAPCSSRSSTSAASLLRLSPTSRRTSSTKAEVSSPCNARSPMRNRTSTPRWRRDSSSVSPAGKGTCPSHFCRSLRIRASSCWISRIENGFGR